ncbi:MAG: nitroreductase family deazaflavin-dependent oxidoreductase [Proteobacteria bacterium]|nr:nitroreductase family deazaflavin-dependent oxidoreductase [Pseudomonadota bacterium]
MSARPLWRVFSQVVAFKPLTLVLLRLATWVDRPLMRMSGGRLRLSFVVPMVLITCTGARSGRKRDVPLLCVPQAPCLLVIASNGGQRKPPAWCYNLRATPQVKTRFGGHEQNMTARELEGCEYTHAWLKAVDAYPGYTTYQQRAGRRIPLFMLEPDGR